MMFLLLKADLESIVDKVARTLLLDSVGTSKYFSILQGWRFVETVCRDNLKNVKMERVEMVSGRVEILGLTSVKNIQDLGSLAPCSDLGAVPSVHWVFSLCTFLPTKCREQMRTKVSHW